MNILTRINLILGICSLCFFLRVLCFMLSASDFAFSTDLVRPIPSVAWFLLSSCIPTIVPVPDPPSPFPLALRDLITDRASHCSTLRRHLFTTPEPRPTSHPLPSPLSPATTLSVERERRQGVRRARTQFKTRSTASRGIQVGRSEPLGLVGSRATTCPPTPTSTRWTSARVKRRVRRKTT
jgi:hypothetical protein